MTCLQKAFMCKVPLVVVQQRLFYCWGWITVKTECLLPVPVSDHAITLMPELLGKSVALLNYGQWSLQWLWHLFQPSARFVPSRWIYFRTSVNPHVVMVLLASLNEWKYGRISWYKTLSVDCVLGWVMGAQGPTLCWVVWSVSTCYKSQHWFYRDPWDHVNLHLSIPQPNNSSQSSGELSIGFLSIPLTDAVSSSLATMKDGRSLVIVFASKSMTSVAVEAHMLSEKKWKEAFWSKVRSWGGC